MRRWFIVLLDLVFSLIALIVFFLSLIFILILKLLSAAVLLVLQIFRYGVFRKQSM